MVFMAAIIATAPSAFALTEDFVGPYDVSLWTETSDGGAGGDVDTTGAPLSIELTSDNNGGPVNPVDFELMMCAGTVSFDWDYESFNFDPVHDPFGFLIDGAFFQLTIDFGPLLQSGSEQVAVAQGELFGFRAATDDAQFGPGVTTVSNFIGPRCAFVGGEYFSLDTTALLVSGAFSNAFWMIPALVGIAGVGAYLAKLKINKRN